MENINFKQKLNKIKKTLVPTVKSYLPKNSKEIFTRAVREYSEREGKYFRPGLLILASQLFGGEAMAKNIGIKKIAAALQLSEDWLLIHDDFFDESEERRSDKATFRPALHKMFGEKIAVNAGDALHALMWRAAGEASYEFRGELGKKIFQKLNNIIYTTIAGQHIELEWDFKKRIIISEKEYYKMALIKSGYYTVIGPLQLGAMASGKASDKDIKNIERWGAPFGLAFQIWDDVMNLTVKSEIQGKETAGDILEGKRTLMLIHLLKNCQVAERRKIIKIYEKNREQKTKQDKKYILSLMEKYQSIEYGKKIARKLSKKALNIFLETSKKTKSERAKNIIAEGIKFVVDRDR